MKKVLLSSLRIVCLAAFFAALYVPGASAQSAAALRRYGGFPIQGTGLKILKRELLTDRKLLQSHKGRCLRSAKLMTKAPFCDRDRDGLSNRIEKRLGTSRRSKDTDGDGISDRYELTKSRTNPFDKDTDRDGKTDGEEIAAGRDPLIPDNGGTPATPNPCAPANFDADGNTTAFGIPAPGTGNITRGSSTFASRCSSCHRTDKGTNLTFSELRSKIAGIPMSITLDDATLSDLTAYLNRTQTGGGQCATPSSTPAPAATPDQTATPEPTPTPVAIGCANQYFDGSGNTTGFTIPSPFVGNIGRGAAYYAGSCNSCHGELGSGFTFAQFKAAVTGPLMNIASVSDAQYADLTAWANRALANAGCGTSTPAPQPTATATRTPASPTATPTGSSCSNQYFDAGGNSRQFGIPSPLTGNISRGTSLYASRCTGCHGERGANFSFSEMKAAVTGPLMNITSISDAQYADLTAWANRALANAGCNTPAPGTPTPVPQPTATATRTPVPPTPTPFSSSCSNQYFDANGNTQQFGIPAPLAGSITQGAGLYSLACSSCHGELGANFTFPQLKSAVTGPKMNIRTVTDQQYAHLTAYLNRSLAPQNCGNPTPTPTPVNDIAAGRTIYDVSCKSCHSRATEFRGISASELRSKLSDVRQMRSIVLSDQQIRQLVAYLASV